MVQANRPNTGAQTQAGQMATIRHVVPTKDGSPVISYDATQLELSRFKNGDIPAASDTAAVVMLAPGCAWIRQTNTLPQLGLSEQSLAAGQSFDPELLWQYT